MRQSIGPESTLSTLKSEISVDSSILIFLGVLASERYMADGELNLIHFAILCKREALLLRPYDDANRAASLSSLAVSLLTRYESLGDSSDLEETIALQRESLLPPPAR